MKNLKINSVEIVRDSILKIASHTCFHSESQRLYFVSGPEICYIHLETKKVSQCTVIDKSLDEDFSVIKMDYIIEMDGIYLVTRKGDIIIFNMLTFEATLADSIGIGLHSVEWSPDQELLVFLTENDTLILMTKDLEIITEESLHPSELGQINPINVGWGSKETQFQGSAGRKAAVLKQMVPKPAVPWDDHKHRISWRSDGQYFVTSVIDPNDRCRRLRIWNREAVLQCTSEIVDGMEQTLCWKMSRNFITSTQQLPNKHEVIFFEKNGLRHGEFTLPFQPNTFVIKEVLWNLDSSIFAVWGHDITDSTPKKFCIMLWTVCNHHWYLKQNLTRDFENLEVKFVSWDQDQANKLHVLCSEGYYYLYTLGWTRSYSIGQDALDDANVAVIDCNNVRVTAFRKMLVPPPMCSYFFRLSCPINAICFAPIHSSSNFLAVLSDGKIAVFKKGIDHEIYNLEHCTLHLDAAGGNGFGAVCQPHSLCGIYTICKHILNESCEAKAFVHYNWIWGENDKLLFITSCEDCSGCYLQQVAIPEEMGKDELAVMFCYYFPCKVVSMCADIDGKTVALLLQNGEVYKFSDGNIEKWTTNFGKHLIFPLSCSSISLCSIQEKIVIVGLTERFQLFCDDTLVMSNCTSFHIHGDFLLVTTYSNELQCLLKSADEGNLYFQVNEQASQKVGKGGKIISSVPASTEVILQMPRGNIEIVHPRALVLALIHKCLDNFEYGKAFSLMKKHRINMNLLYDHNPEQFLENINDVVQEIGSSSGINLFLASLQNEDVCETMYQMTYKAKQRPDSVKSRYDLNKINKICDTFRSVLENSNDGRFFNSLLSTYARKSPPELDQALLKIKEIRDSKDHLCDNYKVSSDEALKFLLYLVNPSELYNVALGTYDFGITIMVAEKSQMDPKQYLPFLNDLKDLEENYRKFKIDMHLRRHKEALLHISKCSDHFEECLKLVKDHRLYKEALHLFPTASEQFTIIWKAYGDYLKSKKYFEEAGLAYTKGEDYENALESYQMCLNWELCICTLKILNYSEEKIVTFCRNLAENLKRHQKYIESSIVLEQYVQDPEESISTLIEGQEWDSALHMMSKYNRMDIVDTHLKPALEEQYQYSIMNFKKLHVDFDIHCQRLKTIRFEKKQASDNLHRGLMENFPDDDMFSDTSSVSDFSSVKTSNKQLSGSLITMKSSKSKRKQNLKKYRLKEGSPNEDLAHMAALSDIIVKVDKLKDDFASFLRALVLHNYISEARNVQESMATLCKVIEEEIFEIWPHPQADQNSSIISSGIGQTSNSIISAMQVNTNVDYSDPAVSKPDWRNITASLNMFQ